MLDERQGRENMNVPTTADYIARIDKGAALLDGYYPEWWQKINLDILDVASGRSCVTAQTYQIVSGDLDTISPWINGGEMLGLDPTSGGLNDYILHGFNAEGNESFWDDELGDYHDSYDYCEAIETINDLWIDLITKRRAEASQ